MVRDKKMQSSLVVNFDDKLSKVCGNISSETQDVFMIKEGDIIGALNMFSLMKSSISASDVSVGKHKLSIKTFEKKHSSQELLEYLIKSDMKNVVIKKNGNSYEILNIFSLLEDMFDKENVSDRPVNRSTLKQIPELKIDTINEAIAYLYENHSNEILYKEKKSRDIKKISFSNILAKYYAIDLEKRDRGMQSNTPAQSVQVENVSAKDLDVNNVTEQEITVLEDFTSIKDILSTMIEKKESKIILKNKTSDMTYVDITDLAKEILHENSTSAKRYIIKGLAKTTINQYNREVIERMISDAGERMQQVFNNEYQLIAKIKEHQKEGDSHRYDIHFLLTYPGENLTSQTSGWNVTSVTKKGLDAIETQLEGKYHNKPPQKDTHSMYQVNDKLNIVEKT